MTNIHQFPPIQATSTNDLIKELRDRLAGMSDTQRKFYLGEVSDGYCPSCGTEEVDEHFCKQ